MLTTETTSFTHDVVGRYHCNTFEEARASTDAVMRADARPFDVIVLGGGSFGPVLAARLFSLDTARRHRILVLEGGWKVLPEHIQNLPPLLGGLGTPRATSIKNLRDTGEDRKARNEVWGLPWHANHDFPGMAYCIGGRSIFFGGWSPQPIDSELSEWPSDAVKELTERQFPLARQQLGTDTTNDFISGPLHDLLRDRLLAGLKKKKIAHALPVKQPDQVEAPLAVVSAATRPGFFPPNKFSAVPLMFRAARLAQSEAADDDVRKRFMVVPGCHVDRLILDGGRIGTIKTNRGDLPVAANAAVVIALGTIESTRLALLSFPNRRGLMGRNLMGHLRSNLTIRIPRARFPDIPQEVASSALFVKGKAGRGHFHIQITASGVVGDRMDSEAELWKKIPDIDWFPAHLATPDDYIVITLRGIGEMFGDKTSPVPQKRIELDPEVDEFGNQRAMVSLTVSDEETELWSAMDQAALDVADVFAAGGTVEYLNPSAGGWQAEPPIPFANTGIRDGLGTTHHEAGPLWMGDDPDNSVTDADGRFHDVANAYVAGPALFPQVGSPNPMLTGVALARATAEAIAAQAAPRTEPDYELLFDGTSLDGWSMAGSGRFLVAGGALETEGGLGMLWLSKQRFRNFVLRLEWMALHADDNSGIFVRFPDPGNDPWIAVHHGYEVQIDDAADPLHQTGAIYGFAAPDTLASKPVGQWNSYEIEVVDQRYTVTLNGETVTTFDGKRGTEGFIGLQNHGAGSRVAFRNIRIKTL